MTPELALYSAAVCPYAQRTHLLLREKGVPYETVEVDLKNKSAEFLAISPYSKVPVIKRGPDVIWESSVINEYLEEAYPNPPMMPREPGRRALARVWIDFANVKLLPTWYRLFLAQDPARQAFHADELTSHFLFMEQAGIAALSPSGPFWLGEHLSLVDLTYWPWFERLGALKHYRNLVLPPECRRLRDWMKVMSARDSVSAIARPTEFYISGYASYADGSEQGVTARDMRAGQ